MGHVRLGILPKSGRWNQVVNELRLGAEVEVVAASAADAAERALQAASDDPAFLHTFWLLTQVPLAARGPDFADDLRRLGVQVPGHPGLMDVVAAISDCVDRHAREQGGRTDLGEMAQMAAVETLVALVGQGLPSLFEPNAGEVQREIGRFAGGDRFSALAREFFARLTQRSLDYYLSPSAANSATISALTSGFGTMLNGHSSTMLSPAIAGKHRGSSRRSPEGGMARTSIRGAD